MNEYRQFGHFTPRFWQEDGILVEVVEAPATKSQRRFGGKWTVALAASTIALSMAITTLSFSVPDAGAGRRTTVTEEAASPTGPTSRYSEVSPDHWAKLRVLMRSFKRTPLMDEFKYPDPL